MKIKKMASCTGESMASNRKNKLICYWDYELELKWECVKKINANDKITGMASIYYLTTLLKPHFTHQLNNIYAILSVRYDKVSELQSGK